MSNCGFTNAFQVSQQSFPTDPLSSGMAANSQVQAFLFTAGSVDVRPG